MLDKKMITLEQDTVLVTGGAGFIGRWLVEQLIIHENVRVVNLDKLTYAGNLDSLEIVETHPNHIFVQGDIGDSALVSDLLNTYHPKAIVNLAAESHVDRSIDGPRVFLQTNVNGTFDLLMAAYQYWQDLKEEHRQQFRFLHVSTDEVYGSLGKTGKFTEDTPYAPNSPYSATKAASDHLVRAFCHTYGFPVVTTNCSNNYGPFQFPEKLIPLMILNAIEGKKLPVYGNGQNIRDWLYVEDHCRAIRLVLSKGKVGETYNIGGDCEKNNLQVVESICQSIDQLFPNLAHHPSYSLISFVEDRPGHDRRYAIDFTKIQTELGWKPEENFPSGLQKTIQWYASHSQWVERVQSGKYRRERIGLSKAQS